MSKKLKPKRQRQRQLRGLEKVCKLYGQMRCGAVMWVWNYHRNVAVPEYRMPVGSPEWKRSEKAKRQA